MKCDKLFKEAFEGIEFRYKLDDTLEGLGEQKFTAKQLEGYLVGKGVSPKEIKQSGIFKGFENDNRAIPADMWLENTFAEKHIIDTYNIPHNIYSDITLGKKGIDNKSYKETLSIVKKPIENAPSTPHFSDEISTSRKSLLGWRRTHIDEINGKKTLVLNEFQSDWAQTERAGRGMFESNQDAALTKAMNELGLTKQDVFEKYDVAELVNMSKTREQEDAFMSLAKGTVADFPMSELKHHQFQIVGAINDAIKEGIDTIAIPIQRENELAGSKGVTKFYESLNTKILPDIRKKLEKQGLKIKVDKKPYIQNKFSPKEIDNILLENYNKLTQEAKNELSWDEISNLDSTYKKAMMIENTNSSFSNSVGFSNDFYKLTVADNDLWTLTIDEVPNGKVKWDVYSIIGALGLSGYINKEEQ